MSFAPERSEIERLYPHALPQWRDAMVKLAPVLCAHYEFDRLRWVHFAAQIGAETNGLSLSPMEEDMRYRSADRILQVFSYRLGLALKKPEWSSFRTKQRLAQHLVGKPDELAKVVYSGREGTPEGAGHLYKGRGPLQTTHKNNYRIASEEVQRQPGGGSCDLLSNPDRLAHDPELGIRVAFAEWEIKKLNRWADNDDLQNVSSVLNTGAPGKWSITNGKENRQRWYTKACSVWPEDRVYEVAKAEIGVLKEGDSGEDVRRLQELLKEKNYFVGNIDDKFGTLTRHAVLAFQSDHGLLADGKVGALTFAALEKAPPRDLGEREQITEKDLKDRGSVTIQKASLGKRVFKWLGWGGSTGGTVYKADQELSLGLVDSALSKGEQVKSLVGRGVDLAAWLPPGWVIWVLGIGGFALLCYGGHRLFESIIQQRVKDAQSGAHRGR
jgi:predicted chitinase